MFGREGSDDVPISTAVRASGALPMVYAPVRVKDRELIDGGIVSTTNLDIAVEAGAQARGRDQPDRAVRQRLRRDGQDAAREAPAPGLGHGLSRRSATRRSSCVAHQRLHELAKRWEERYPGVDIVLIEPEPADELMFQTSMMNFASRVEIARHGFESVTKHLAGEYERYQEVAERHGLEISAKRRAQGASSTSTQRARSR